MHEPGKSDNCVVPKKAPNKARRRAAEGLEGRRLAKQNSPQATTLRTQGRARVHAALGRVRQAAEQKKGVRFTALLHHIYAIDTLRAAFYDLERDAAPGVDGETWEHYGEELEANLAELSDRLRHGAYRPQPVRRVFIPKRDGKQRPIGVTTIASYCLSRRCIPESSAQVMRIRHSLSARCLNLGSKRDTEAANCAATSCQVAAFDPVIDSIGADAEARSDPIDAQLSWFESSRGRHSADVADPLDGCHVKRTTHASLHAACVELCDQVLIACVRTQLADKFGGRVRRAFGLV
jgi:hypothetical protein